MTSGKNFDLQDRLIDFAVETIKMTKLLPHSDIGRHIKSQILRSGTSPAANYGEAKGAESRQDFIHKLKLSFKELRETQVWLLILQRTMLLKNENALSGLLIENEELISIIFRSVDTAKTNMRKKKSDLKSNTTYKTEQS